MTYAQALQWLHARSAQHEAEGLDAATARAKALSAFTSGHPDFQERTRLEAEFAPAAAASADLGTIRVRVESTPAAPVAERAAPEKPEERAAPEAKAAKVDAEDEDEPEAEERTDADEVVERTLRRLARGGDAPMAAIASGLERLGARARNPMEPDQLLSAVLERTIVPQLAGRQPNAQELVEVRNMLRDHGVRGSIDGSGPVENRALTIAANGTVIYTELARLFAVRPADDTVFRNHVRSIPMGNVKKRTFPRFDRAGMAFGWNRAAGAALDNGDPTLNTFDIEVGELQGDVVVDDGFGLFNAAAGSFVSQYLLPEMRGAAQQAEDGAFFLSDGVDPYPTTFKGLKHATGVTAITASTDGDAFTVALFEAMLRAMPTKYRANPSRLVFYVPVGIADDYAELIATRQTALGDSYLGGTPTPTASVTPGPSPAGYYRGIPVVGVYHLTQDETQGTSDVAGTCFLVHRDIPVIGDALSIRMEPYRLRAFQTALQLQEYVGLGYQWPDAIVRRPGVLAAA